MDFSLNRRKRSDLFTLIMSALMIELEWVSVMLSPRWSHYGSWTEWYKAGVFAAVLAGVLAAATYVWWARMFEKTDKETREELPYKQSRNIANICLLLFVASQLLL